MIEAITAVLILGGVILAFLGALGLQQFPDVFARMHAATKAVSLGLMMIMAGAALHVSFPDDAVKLLLVIGFTFITAPIGAHMIGRAAYRAGTELSPDTQVDELAGAPPPQPFAGDTGGPAEEELRARPAELIPALAWMMLVWVALWGTAGPHNVLGGLVAGTLLLLLFPRLRPRTFVGSFRPLRALWFGIWFVWKLAEANLVVAWEVITPNNEDINEGIVAVPVAATSDAMITVVANAISLTPGTLTLEVRREPTVLYVHVLHLRDIEQVRRDVAHLERYAVRAFGSEEDVARVEERWARLG